MPGLKRWIGSAGHLGLTSAQVLASDEKILASSARVTPSSSQVFSGLTTTARASVPTRNSTGVRPMAWQLSTSLDLMARLALAMSVSPVLQKRSRPAPDPIESMVMLPL